MLFRSLFALSTKPNLADAGQPVSIETLLPAMKGHILGAADLTVTYTRSGSAGEEEERRPARKGPPPPGGKGE